MRLPPEQLAGHLRSGLRPTYLLASDEPLLIDEGLDAIRAAARQAGLAERESFVADKKFDWGQVSSALGSLSLFSAGKVVEVRLPAAAPGDEGSRAIRALADRPADGNVVVLITPWLDRRTGESAWVKAIDEHGVRVDARRPGLADLPRWLRHRLGSLSLDCDDEGLELIASRVEGNLLAARQELDKLALLNAPGSRLTADDVRQAVGDGARFDVFQLADAALGGELLRAARILAGLRDEGVAPPLVLWALVREVLVLVDAAARAAAGTPVARAIDEAGIRPWRRDIYMGALRRPRTGSLRGLLVLANRADQVVKGARPGEPWNALLELAAAMAGRADLAGEIA